MGDLNYVLVGKSSMCRADSGLGCILNICIIGITGTYNELNHFCRQFLPPHMDDGLYCQEYMSIGWGNHPPS